MKNTPRYIIIHGSDVSYHANFDQLKAINIYHRDTMGFPVSSLGYYVGYQRLITGDKNYQCRIDTEEGAHCNQQINGLSINFQSLGICMGGDFDVELPTSMQYALLQKQVWLWQDQWKIPNENVYFHRHFATTKTCPGSLLDDKWLATLLIRPVAVVVPPKPIENTCTAQEQVIAQQTAQIGRLQQLVQDLLAQIRSWFNRT